MTKRLISLGREMDDFRDIVSYQWLSGHFVSRDSLCFGSKPGKPRIPLATGVLACSAAPSWLRPLIGVGDRLERRVDEIDLAVQAEIEARDIDGLPDLVEGDVLGEQGLDLWVEACDLDPDGNRLRALGEFPIGIEVDADVVVARRDAADRGRFLVRLGLRDRSIRERDERGRIAKAVAVERRASGLGTVSDFNGLRRRLDSSPPACPSGRGTRDPTLFSGQGNQNRRVSACAP
jgi:hypothetical protein